jgi:hypothetical protein
MSGSRSQQPDPDELGFWSEAPILLAVHGEFGVGKTTVFDALIKEEIPSVTVEPATTGLTRLRYGCEIKNFRRADR